MARLCSRLLACAALLLSAAPAAAEASTPVVPQTPGVGQAELTAAGVARYYEAQGSGPIWFRPGNGGELPEVLAQILRRAQLDGLSSGPMLAGQVQVAALRARGGTPADVKQAERILSQAWVLYVQALSKPAPGMIYGDPSLVPQAPRAERILYEASRAPSLAQHLQSVSSVNPIYSQLREAGWQQMQQTGSLPDSRLLANLERARALPGTGDFLVADIATARLWMFENGVLRDSMKIIVGRKDEPTPMIASTIHYTTFNPYWNVPMDVVRRVAAPAILKDGKAYIKKMRYEVVDSWTDDATVLDPDSIDWKAVANGSKTEIRIRQLPGPDNMMGHYKFSFPNEQGIYLHDTPSKGLFGNDQRTFSLGCVRVEDAKRLAQWLLRREPTPPSASPEQHVALGRGVPIYLTYLTAHVDGGKLAFSKDVYGLDGNAGSQVAAAN